VEALVNILGVITASACAVLLYRGYRRTGARLLWWSAICFLGLSLENAVLFIDINIVPDVDLALIRLSISAAGTACLVYGLVWESK
jgi:hypothetical protein